MLKYLCACILHLINLYCTWAAKPLLRFPILLPFAETGMMWVFCILQEFPELCNGRDEGSFQVREKEGEECVYSGVCVWHDLVWVFLSVNVFQMAGWVSAKMKRHSIPESKCFGWCAVEVLWIWSMFVYLVERKRIRLSSQFVDEAVPRQY